MIGFQSGSEKEMSYPHNRREDIATMVAHGCTSSHARWTTGKPTRNRGGSLCHLPPRGNMETRNSQEHEDAETAPE